MFRRWNIVAIALLISFTILFIKLDSQRVSLPFQNRGQSIEVLLSTASIKTGGNELKETHLTGSILHSNTPLITMIDSNDMNNVRELVGSVHYFHPYQINPTKLESLISQHTSIGDVLPHVIIYGFRLTYNQKREVKLWQNVDFIDVDDALGKSPSQVEHENQTSTIRNKWVETQLLQLILHRYGAFIYVDNNYKMKQNAYWEIMTSELMKKNYLYLSQNKSLAVLGLKDHTFESKLLIEWPLKCYRNYHCPVDWQKQLAIKEKTYQRNSHIDWNIITPVDLKSSKPMSCYLSIRDDVFYNDLYEMSTLRNQSDPSNGKILIAIGMPTLSKNLLSFKEVQPLKTFLPSFLKSLREEEWKQFRFNIYIGYDEMDEMFGSEKSRKNIDTALYALVNKSNNIHRDILFIYQSFPYSFGWTSFLWNGLFVRAMVKEKSQYFYQVNDDLAILSTGWLTEFVRLLKVNDNLGVTGPYDPFQHGRMLTQAFVHKNHYDIFGRFYPQDIKNWWSDDWITKVYGSKLTSVAKNHRIKNGNTQTRYKVCSSPKFEEITARTELTLKNYLDHNFSAISI